MSDADVKFGFLRLNFVVNLAENTYASNSALLYVPTIIECYIANFECMQSLNSQAACTMQLGRGAEDSFSRLFYMLP